MISLAELTAQSAALCWSHLRSQLQAANDNACLCVLSLNYFFLRCSSRRAQSSSCCPLLASLALPSPMLLLLCMACRMLCTSPANRCTSSMYSACFAESAPASFISTCSLFVMGSAPCRTSPRHCLSSPFSCTVLTQQCVWLICICSTRHMPQEALTYC